MERSLEGEKFGHRAAEEETLAEQEVDQPYLTVEEVD